MKKIILFLTLMFSVASMVCSQNQSDKKASEETVVPMDKQMFLDKVFDYTSGATEWKYKGDKPALIDFYANWCGPCRMISPIVKSLAKEYADSIVVYKVDVDKEKALAGEMGIQSLPTLVFIPMSGRPQIIVGATDKATLRRAITEVLLK